MRMSLVPIEDNQKTEVQIETSSIKLIVARKSPVSRKKPGAFLIKKCQTRGIPLMAL